MGDLINKSKLKDLFDEFATDITTLVHGTGSNADEFQTLLKQKLQGLGYNIVDKAVNEVIPAPQPEPDTTGGETT